MDVYKHLKIHPKTDWKPEREILEQVGSELFAPIKKSSSRTLYKHTQSKWNQVKPVTVVKNSAGFLHRNAQIKS